MQKTLTGMEFLRANEIKNMKCHMEEPYVFISYSHDSYDSQIVMNVFQSLYQKGFNLWIDTANMPLNENDWKLSAADALRGENCRFAFFFRSESSMVKETVAKELQLIKDLYHIEVIVTIDIWHEDGNNAAKHYKKILNDKDNDAFRACEKVCDIVSVDNKAIRLGSDAGNDITRLSEEMEEVLRDRGLKPAASRLSGEVLLPEVRQVQGKEKQSQSSHNITKMELECQKGPGGCDSGKKRRRGRRLYTFAFDGQRYENYKLNEMMRIVFQGILMAHKDKIDVLLEKLPCLREGNLIGKNAEPTVFRSGFVLDIENRQISIGTSLDANTVQDYIRRLIVCCREPEEIFKILHVFEKTEDGMTYSKINHQERKRDLLRIKPGAPANAASSSSNIAWERKRTASKTYSFELYGTRHEDQKLKDLMLIVFQEVMPKHADKLEAMLDKLPCLKEGDFIGKNASPTVFRSGGVITLAGKEISVGTSLNKESVFTYIDRLLSICKEPKDVLIIDD